MAHEIKNKWIGTMVPDSGTNMYGKTLFKVRQFFCGFSPLLKDGWWYHGRVCVMYVNRNNSLKKIGQLPTSYATKNRTKITLRSNMIHLCDTFFSKYLKIQFFIQY